MLRKLASRQTWKIALRGVGIACIWLLIWQLGSTAVASELLFPSPGATLKSFLRLVGETGFFLSVSLSLLRVVVGFLGAVVLGVLLGILTAASPFFNALFRPFRSVIKATPVASFILLLILWVKSPVVPALIAVLTVLPLVWTNVQEGVQATDRSLLEMAKLFRFGRGKILQHIYLPAVLPQLVAACATGLGFAWKASVAAEVIARTANSIGKNLVESKNYLETADMFAWTAVVIALSILVERVLRRLLRTIRSGSRWGDLP